MGYAKDDKKVVLPVELLRNRMNENIIRAWLPQIDCPGKIPAGTDRRTKTRITETVSRSEQFEELHTN